MKQEFFQLHQEKIIIVNKTKEYADTLANFLLDCPHFQTEKKFILYVRHEGQLAEDKDFQIDIFNSQYDEYINNVETFLERQTARQPALPEPTFAELQENLLATLEKSAQVAYTGGFLSEATGFPVTYDSTEDDQRTFNILYNASLSPDFETAPDYQGLVPVRGVPAGAEEKETYLLDKNQLQKLVDDLARHLGAVKLKHWTLQAEVKQAADKEALAQISW